MAEYINRQALLRYLNDIWLTATPNDFMPDDDRHLAMVRCMGLNDAMDAVKSIPAADVRPVRRGKWIDMGDFISCSSCNATRLKEFESDYGRVMRLDARANFCPRCGADMRPTSMSGANGEES